MIYTSTRLCVPKTLNICREPEKLWASTFLQYESQLRQLMFDPEISTEPMPQSLVSGMKCFTGEPDLEKLMSNGNRVTDHQRNL